MLSQRSAALAYLAEGVMFHGQCMTRRDVYEWYQRHGQRYVDASRWMLEYDEWLLQGGE